MKLQISDGQIVLPGYAERLEKFDTDRVKVPVGSRPGSIVLPSGVTTLDYIPGVGVRIVDVPRDSEGNPIPGMGPQHQWYEPAGYIAATRRWPTADRAIAAASALALAREARLAAERVTI